MIEFKNIQDWFKQNCLDQEKFIATSLDIDYFVKKNRDPLGFVKNGIKLFNELIGLCKDYKILEDIMPGLLFPLSCIEESEFSIFNPENFILEKELDDMSPGDISLIKREYIKDNVYEEQYKRIVNIKFPMKLPSNCKIYYICFRDNQEVKNRWEFNRHISIEHFSNEWWEKRGF